MIRKYAILIFLAFIFFCCTKKNDLTNVIKINEKLIVFKQGTDNYSVGNTISIKGDRCVIEEKIIYDDIGRCMFLYKGGSEGLIPQSRNYIKGYLPLEQEELNYSIKIDREKNWIIDNTDTIRVFKIFKNEIITNTDSNNRFCVYKYTTVQE